MNKLTKLLSVFVIAGALGAGMVGGAVGCKGKGGDDDGHTHVYQYEDNGDGATHTATCKDGDSTIPDERHVDNNHDNVCDLCMAEIPAITGVTVSANADKVLINGGLQLYATVTGTGNPAQTVTWRSSDTTKATVTEEGVVMGVAAGSVTITATSTIDTTKSNTISLTVASSAVPQEEADRAIVPGYTGAAAGPEAGEKQVTTKFLATSLAIGALEEDYNDGFVTVAKGTLVRNKGEKDGKYSAHSINNGSFKINVPVAGTLKLCFSSGSGTPSNAKYKLTKPDGSTIEENVTGKAQWELVELTVEDAQPGEYKFEKAGGTIELWEIRLDYTITGAPIKEISVTSPGTTDYMVTQKVDCTDVSVIAKDENGVPFNVNLANCTFDTSAYNPNKSGEYEIGVTYHLADNLDSDTTELSTTYKVKVYAVDAIELSTIGHSSTQVTAQQAALPGATFSSANLSVVGTCGLGGNSITQKLKSDWVTVSTPSLAAEGTQKVTVTVNPAYTTYNRTVTASYEIAVKAKKAVVDNKVEVTVGETGEFKTLTQAVQYLKACNFDKTVDKIIKLQAGTYTEKVYIDLDNVTLIGLGTKVDDTAITYSLVEGDVDYMTGTVWALDCATVHVKGSNFKAYNLAIRNDFDYIANNKKYPGTQGAQGVALTLEGDGNVIYNCHLFGNQDTLYMKAGRSYYYKTQVDGNIDFIFGGSTSVAYFEECEIKAIDRENKTSEDPQNGYITAPQHAAATKPDYGYVFYKCNITEGEKVNANSMSLGRPWGPAATVSYIECKFSAAYSKEASNGSHKIHRWNNWDSNITAEGADYSEYGSMDASGNPIMTEAVTGGKVLTAEQAANYTKENAFGTSNGKIGYSAAFDCTAALNDLLAMVDPNSTIEVTVTDTEGNSVTTLKVPKGDTLTIEAIKSSVNAKLAASEKEVDKIYSAYTDATTNTEYTEKAINTPTGIIVSVKTKAFTEKSYTLIDLIESKITYKEADGPIAISNTDLYLTGGSLNPNDNSGCCIAEPGTKITFDLVGEVTLAWYNGGTTQYGQDGDAKIVYKDGKATITLGNRVTQFYIRQINIDLTKTPDDTPDKNTYNVTFNLNGMEGTAPASQTVEEGEKATEPFVLVRAGYKFLGWYTAAEAGEKYDFGAVTAGVDLYAHWEAVTTPVIIEENANISFGTSGNYQSYIASTAIIGTNVNASTYRNNGGNNSQLSDTFSIKVKAGAVIRLSTYDGFTDYTVTVNGGEPSAKQTGTSYEFTVDANGQDVDYATVTFTCGSQNYFYSISVTYPGEDVITTSETITFGTAGNYETYIGNGKLASTCQIGGTNANDSQIKNGTLTIKVKAGATVAITAYHDSAYVGYTVTVNGGTASETQTSNWTSSAMTEDSTIVITPTQGNNYLVSIAVTYAA